MTFIACLAIIIACVVAARQLHGTVLVPWCLYTVAWVGMVGLYSLDWIEYIDVRPTTWAVVAITFGSFWCGSICSLAPVIWAKSLCLPLPPTWFIKVNLRRFELLYFWLALLAGVGISGYYYAVAQIFGFTTLWSNPGSIRGLQSGDDYVAAFFWWKFPFYLNWVACLLGFARILMPGKRAPKWIVITCLGFFLFNFTLVSRAHLLLLLVPAAVILSAYFGHRRGRAEAIVLVTVLLVVVVYFVVMGELLGKTYEYNARAASDFHGPEILRPLTGFYIYITANIPALQCFMLSSAGPHTYGAFQFLPAAKILSKLGLLQTTPEEIGDYAMVPFPFNTYTYLNTFLLDCGICGLILGPFSYGLLSHWLFIRTCERRDVWYLIGHGFMCCAILSSVGANVLVSTPEWEFGVVLWLGYLWTREDQYPKPPAPARANPPPLSATPCTADVLRQFAKSDPCASVLRQR